MAEVSKEVDDWLSGISKLLKAVDVKDDAIPMLEGAVQHVLKELGNEKLQTMDEAAVLVAVRDGVPKMRGNILRPEYIAEKSAVVAKIVEAYFTANKIRSAGLKTLGDGVVNELETRIAEYIAKLPSDIKVERDGLTLVLSKEGAAGKLEKDEWSISADADAGGVDTKLQVDTKDLKLKLESQGTSLRFDGQLKHVQGDLDLLVELHARRGQFKDDDSPEAIAIDAKLEATYKDLKVKLDGSLKQFDAKLEYLKKEPGLKEVTAKFTTDYKTFQADLKLFYQKKNTEVLLKAMATGNKLEVELNAKTLTAGGTNIQGEVKATLERVDATIEIFRRRKDANLKFVGSLESDYKDLKAKAELVYSSSGAKQVELIAKFEATLDRVKATIEASIQTEAWRFSAAASLDSVGTASGRADVMLKLGDGIQILGKNAYLKVGADVNDKRWSVFVGISLTNPPKAADVKKLIGAAENNINGAYGVLASPKFQGSDATTILSEMGKHLKAAPPSVSLEAGFFLSDDIPRANVPDLPMVGGVGIKVQWF